MLERISQGPNGLDGCRVWLAHDKGMVPMKFQQYMQGELARAVEVDELAKASTASGDIWYPTKAHTEGGFSWFGRTKYEIIAHRFVPHAALADDAFNAEFPAGTRVFDKGAGVWYTAGQSGDPKPLPPKPAPEGLVTSDKAVSPTHQVSVPVAETSPAFGWWIVVLSAVLIAAVVVAAALIGAKKAEGRQVRG